MSIFAKWRGRKMARKKLNIARGMEKNILQIR
jgi:hypothetical protein